MSRMLAFSSPTPISWADAVGAERMGAFSALASLHADGWGAASTEHGEAAYEHGVRGHGSVDPFGPAAIAELAAAPPASAGLLYLRFASAGPPALDDIQPFVRDGVAFQHNGALAPRDALIALLDDDERSRLRGTTDSEVYAARVRREILALDPAQAPAQALAQAVARGVGAVRARFGEACLNAFVLAHGMLAVVHSPGSVPLPAAAFARRGWRGDLPPGHDERYNVLSVTRDPVVTVATTGIDQSGWDPLPVETVSVFMGDAAPAAVARIPVD